MNSRGDARGLPSEYILQIDGNVKAKYQLFVDALKAGLQLKRRSRSADAAVETYARRYGTPQNHKREGAVSVSAMDETCRPMDATTIELPDLPIYAIEGLDDRLRLWRSGCCRRRPVGRSVAGGAGRFRVEQRDVPNIPLRFSFLFPKGQVSPCFPPCFSLLFLFGEIYLSP